MCLQIRLIVELLFCGILFGPTQAWLAYGEGTQFQKVVWYHFPKTGGTTMRGIVHKFCESRGYHMTGNYKGDTPFGRKTNHDAFHAGSAPHFIYGHSEEDFARYAENTRTNTSTGSSEKSRNSGGSGSGSGSEQVEEQEREVLYVFMVRSPLPWMLSRHQHHLRKAENAHSNFTQSVTSFGQEYFQFLDPVLRNLSTAWFERSIEHTKVVGSQGISDSMTDESKDAVKGKKEGKLDAGVTLAASPAGITSTLERLLFQSSMTGAGASAVAGHGEFPFHSSSNRNVVVLVQDHYTESLIMLDHVFATTHFTASSSYRHNTAREAQDKGVSLGFDDELHQVNRLLEMHQALYHLCLRYFLRHLDSIRTM